MFEIVGQSTDVVLANSVQLEKAIRKRSECNNLWHNHYSLAFLSQKPHCLYLMLSRQQTNDQ